MLLGRLLRLLGLTLAFFGMHYYNLLLYLILLLNLLLFFSSNRLYMQLLRLNILLLASCLDKLCHHGAHFSRDLLG